MVNGVCLRVRRIWVVALGALLVACASCGPGLSVSMTSPQESAENLYVGPDLEISFRFEPTHIVVQLKNVGASTAALDWSQATFAGPDGKPVRLVSVGDAPVRSLRPGASARVEMTPQGGGCARPVLWHRRTSRTREVVAAGDVPSAGAEVRVLLPVQYVTASGDQVPEILQFRFRVKHAVSGSSGAQRDKPRNNDAYRELFD